MDKSAALETIDRFRTILERKDVTVDKIILYGSFARGDYRDDSDIDLIVISDDFASLNYCVITTINTKGISSDLVTSQSVILIV
jgi:predicted nucleotidyltransferase